MIRAADHPVRPARPARPGRQPNADLSAQPASGDPANVYVYRDTGGSPAGHAAGPDESDAAYWYGRREEDPPAVNAEYRGFFEPLVSSAAPPPYPAPSGALPPHGAPSYATPPDKPPHVAASDAGYPGPGFAMAAGRTGPDAADGLEDPAHARARKLEQIKDFYLTAEAIGEENVDKHFDQLLAHQRELISEYFRQSAAKLGGTPAPQPSPPASQPEAMPGDPGRDPASRDRATRDQAAQAGPPEAVVAEKPRT